MASAFAGQFSAANAQSVMGARMGGLAVSVYVKGTNTLASLYTDRTKASAASNPFTSAASGLSFFADPGLYDVAVGNTRHTVQVTVDTNEYVNLNPSGVPFNVWLGIGAPNAATGSNKDLYIQGDGGNGTTFYQKRSGTWTATT